MNSNFCMTAVSTCKALHRLFQSPMFFVAKKKSSKFCIGCCSIKEYHKDHCKLR